MAIDILKALPVAPRTRDDEIREAKSALEKAATEPGPLSGLALSQTLASIRAGLDNDATFTDTAGQPRKVANGQIAATALGLLDSAQAGQESAQAFVGGIVGGVVSAVPGLKGLGTSLQKATSHTEYQERAAREAGAFESTGNANIAIQQRVSPANGTGTPQAKGPGFWASLLSHFGAASASPTKGSVNA